MRHLHIYLLLLTAVLTSCTGKIDVTRHIDSQPSIFPDYTDVTMPCNIAPPTFRLADSIAANDCRALFVCNGTTVEVNADDGDICIDMDDWHTLTQSATDISVTVQRCDSDVWSDYQPFVIHISPHPVDPYIAYRLIEPGYEVWNEMGIYQRCLETYHESEIMTNRTLDHQCINCHSFCNATPEQMLFHVRKDPVSGTFIIKNGEVERLNTKTDATISPLVYPSWHPGGRFVAFSTNFTQQSFHTSHTNRIEVFDSRSDVVVYDTELHEIVTSPLLSADNAWETFPTFSPDGATLYFCTAQPEAMPSDYDKVHYSLCSVSFDPTTRQFGSTVDTLYHAADSCSVSFPRVSPDGRWLMFTRHAYGTFSIWHHDADLWMLPLRAATTPATPFPLRAANSPAADSYHSWSTNSRWIVFASRRMDGLYTRPFIAHVADDGTVSKAFAVPQSDSRHYDRSLKSYNIPEFITGPVRDFRHIVSTKAHNEEGRQVTFSKQ